MYEKPFEGMEELPVIANLLTIEDYPLHYHDCIQILYVMSGSIELRVSFADYFLNEGDIHIVNIRDVHAIKGIMDENIVLSLYLNTSFYIKDFPDIEDKIFISYQIKRKAQNGSYRKLIELMKQAVKKTSEHGNKIMAKIGLIGRDCLEILYEDFQYFSINYDEKKFKMKTSDRVDKINSERINIVVEQIYKNYNYKVGLKELSEKLHISKYYLSRIIKANTGENLQNFTNLVRAEMSEILLDTDKSMTEIALECGFSNSQYYRDHFMKWFGMSPINYRKEYQNKTLGEIPSKFKKISSKIIKESNNDKLINIDYYQKYEEKPYFLKSCFLKLIESEMLQARYMGADILDMLTQSVICSGNDYIVTRISNGINILIFQYSNLRPNSLNICINNLPKANEVIVRKTSIVGKQIHNENCLLNSDISGILQHRVSLQPDSVNMISFLIKMEM